MDCVLILFQYPLKPVVPDPERPCPTPSWETSLKFHPVLSRCNDVYSSHNQPIGKVARLRNSRLCNVSQLPQDIIHGVLSEWRDQMSGETEYDFRRETTVLC
ncbi:hypothetical protein NPIL_639561 [Nephila pilipes]|uniref:Uncharacterized protein n=1 Tax=Nephila pilipes TaxID=299642 RepID=A0A8X6JF75_NEPPI|nr:hypothetical protein NPIL_639561 [Nephila pilipes]